MASAARASWSTASGGREGGGGKLRAVRLRLSFNDYASQALFRRVAETTNLAPFVKQALTHDEAIHRKPDLPRGK